MTELVDELGEVVDLNRARGLAPDYDGNLWTNTDGATTWTQLADASALVEVRTGSSLIPSWPAEMHAVSDAGSTVQLTRGRDDPVGAHDYTHTLRRSSDHRPRVPSAPLDLLAGWKV